MILALMSDIHGNSTALDAVIADADGTRVDAWWVLGDLVAFGPDPVGVVETVRSLNAVTVIAGNTERYVAQGQRPYPSISDVRADASLIDRLVEVAESLAWTRGAITEKLSLDPIIRSSGRACSLLHPLRRSPTRERRSTASG